MKILFILYKTSTAVSQVNRTQCIEYFFGYLLFYLRERTNVNSLEVYIEFKYFLFENCKYDMLIDIYISYR